ncbi:transketolase family protein [Microbacterium sp. NPDC078428]|uniref:transketolase family protein n=1 Tax=Microbacterium sp. NPDC078428 TaxID=3364190 RepID=UPI0037C7BD8C
MLSMREAWGNTLADLTEENERILVVDPDVANSTRADIVADRAPDRFIEVGIAEQNAIGVATGLAAEGWVPWTSTFSPFLTHRAIDQVRMLVAQTGANVKLAGAYAGLLTGATGKTHQDVQDIAIIRAMPGMTLLAPADAVECAAMVRWACAHDGPVYMRLARDAEPNVFGPDHGFELGCVHTLKEGDELALVSTGIQTGRTHAAARELAEGGVSARVIHVPTIKPIDADGLVAALGDVPLVVTVEDHSVLGGLGGLVAEIVSERSPRRVLRIGLDDTWTESAPNDFLLEKYGLSSARVAATVRTLVDGLSPH